MEGCARARRRDALMLIALAVCGWCLGYGLTDRACDANQRRLVAASARQAAVVQQRNRSAVIAAQVASTSAADTATVAETRDRSNSTRASKGGAATEAAAAPNVVSASDASGVMEAARRSKAARASKAVRGTSAVSASEALRAAALVEVAGHASVAPAESVALVERALPLRAAGRTLMRARVASSAPNMPEAVTRKVDWDEEPSPVVSPEEMNRALTLAAASKKIFASVDENVRTVPPTAAETPRAEPAAATAIKVVSIEALYVEGGVPSRVVSRGVQRLLPQFARCREFCDTEPQRMKLSTTIDEAGRGRQVTVEGLSRPGLRRCLEQATARLVVPAPDTGTARARWIVRFASR
jgi:hypothetical protein